jgi:hypothetical protein
MSHQFKSGDLAIIIGGPNTGSCVELISFHASGDVRMSSGCWTRADVPSWKVTGPSLTARLEGIPGRYKVAQGLICQSLLMPLRGDFAPEKAESREVPA